jgi:hypothetical protein
VWTCDRCERTFGAVNRPHVCEPGMPVGLWLESLPDGQRAAAAAVLAVARRCSGVVIEAVNVGVFIKRERTLVELRPKTRWLDMSFFATGAVGNPRIARTLKLPSGEVYCYVHLTGAADVDADVRGWVKDALRTARPATRRPTAPGGRSRTARSSPRR